MNGAEVWTFLLAGHVPRPSDLVEVPVWTARELRVGPIWPSSCRLSDWQYVVWLLGTNLTLYWRPVEGCPLALNW